jgi:type IV pilus assembly protein PilV
MSLFAGTRNGMKSQGENGFTLIEVMFAAVYLAVGLLAIASLVGTALSRDVDSRRMTIATNLAAEMIERIRFN